MPMEENVINFIYSTLAMLSLFSLQHNYFLSGYLESIYRKGIRIYFRFCGNTDKTFLGYLSLSFSCYLGSGTYMCGAWEFQEVVCGCLNTICDTT